MNWDELEGKRKQVTGSVKARWGKLTDDDLRMISGHKDQLVGNQERYGIQQRGGRAASRGMESPLRREENE
jgi:uncharacterized protein YjbJ (UPF0337 family)